MIDGGKPLPPDPSDPHEIVNIQYTSGTTGAPKGMLLTHHNLLNNGAAPANWMNYTEHDRCVIPFPLYHCAGCVCGVLACLDHGATTILPSAQFDAGAVLAAIENERATVVAGVPTMFIALLEHPEFARFNVSTVRAGFIGGAPCPTELMRSMMERLNCRKVTVIYGQTEASPVVTMSHPEDSAELRVTTVGRACPNTEVKVIDAATGETLPTGMQGELCSRGYMIMKWLRRRAGSHDARCGRRRLAAFRRPCGDAAQRPFQNYRPRQRHFNSWRREHFSP